MRWYIVNRRRIFFSAVILYFASRMLTAFGAESPSYAGRHQDQHQDQDYVVYSVYQPLDLGVDPVDDTQYEPSQAYDNRVTQPAQAVAEPLPPASATAAATPVVAGGVPAAPGTVPTGPTAPVTQNLQTAAISGAPTQTTQPVAPVPQAPLAGTGRAPASVAPLAQVQTTQVQHPSDRRPLPKRSPKHMGPPKDYYVNMGTKHGVAIGSILEVRRRISTYDLLSEQLYRDVTVPLARIKVIHAEPNASIARLEKLLPTASSAGVTPRAVMVGDLVRLAPPEPKPDKPRKHAHGLSKPPKLTKKSKKAYAKKKVPQNLSAQTCPCPNAEVTVHISREIGREVSQAPSAALD